MNLFGPKERRYFLALCDTQDRPIKFEGRLIVEVPQNLNVNVRQIEAPSDTGTITYRAYGIQMAPRIGDNTPPDPHASTCGCPNHRGIHCGGGKWGQHERHCGHYQGEN